MNRTSGHSRALGLALLLSCAVAVGCDGTLQAYFARDVVDVVEDLPYVAGSSDPHHTLDLYLPRGVTGFPVVVFVHGGYWSGQDKRYFQAVVGLYGNVGIALARHGIGVAVINYRLVPSVAFPQQLGDVAQAVRWVQDHIAAYDGDPKRIVLSGHSSGGHITALAAFDPSRLAAAGVDLGNVIGYAPLSPILDLAHMAAHPPPSVPDFQAKVIAPTFGTDLKTYSPSTYFKKDVKPVLIAMGDADEPFLVEQIPAAVAELKAMGAPVTFHNLAKHTHEDLVLTVGTAADQVSPLLIAFVRSLP